MNPPVDKPVLIDSHTSQINLLWERTQAGIAIVIVLANIVHIFVLLYVPIVSNAATNAATLLGNGFFLIVGFYFGRTNHTRSAIPPNKLYSPRRGHPGD